MINMKGLGLTMAYLSGILAVMLLVASFSEKVKYPLHPLFIVAAAGFLVAAFIILLLVTILIHLDKMKNDGTE
jgi:hypothetical protein